MEKAPENDSTVRSALSSALRQLNERLSYKRAPVRKLESVLELKKKDRLLALTKALQISGSSHTKKGELTAAIAGELQKETVLEAILTGTTAAEFDLFVRAAEEDVFFRADESIPMQALVLFGLCAAFLEEDRVRVLVPDELKALWAEMKKGDFIRRKELIELIHRYALAAVHLYGQIRLKALARLVERFEEEEVNEEDVRSSVTAHLNREPPYYLWDDRVVHPVFSQDTESLEALIDSSAGIPRFVPDTREELLRYSDPAYMEDCDEYRALVDFLTEDIGDSRMGPLMAGDVKEVLAAGTTDDNCMLMLRTCGLEYDEPEISGKVYSLLRGMRRKTRYWALRGHTEAEKRVLETPARNDKCPCGSGAKYKKCCAGK